MPTFKFPLSYPHITLAPTGKPHVLEIDYDFTKSANHINVVINKITFTPLILNYYNYTPKLFSEIFNAAKEHAKNIISQ